MERIEQIVERRQDLVRQKQEIENEITALSADIVETLGVFQGSQEIAGWSVSVTSKRTFNPKIAEQILTKKRVKKSDLYKEPSLDPKKVKTMYPAIYDDACIEGATFATVREA